MTTVRTTNDHLLDWVECRQRWSSAEAYAQITDVTGLSPEALQQALSSETKPLPADIGGQRRAPSRREWGSAVVRLGAACLPTAHHQQTRAPR